VKSLHIILIDNTSDCNVTHPDSTPASKPVYPYMVQYLLETYAKDDELAKAYHTAVTARQRENEDDRAFALRLRQIAASAGDIFDKATLKSIFVDGLAEYVHDILRVHVTPSMPFPKAQRVAHQLGKSLSRTSESSHSVGGSRKKEEHASVRPNMTSASAFEEEEDDSSVSGQMKPKGGGDLMEAALLAKGTQYPCGYNRVRSTTSHSTESSVFSVPTRGWDCRSASVVSAPIGGSRTPREVPRENLFFMCYRPGHVVTDFPQLPGEVREQATHNRALNFKTSPTTLMDSSSIPTPTWARRRSRVRAIEPRWWPHPRPRSL
jgi:hypothetical protein